MRIGYLIRLTQDLQTRGIAFASLTDRAVGISYVRGTRRVRAQSDSGADDGWLESGTSLWSLGRSATEADSQGSQDRPGASPVGRRACQHNCRAILGGPIHAVSKFRRRRLKHAICEFTGILRA